MTRAVWLVLVAAACQKPEEPVVWDGGTLAAPIGAWAKAPGYELRVVALRDCPSADAGAPPADRRPIALDVELVATGGERVPVNAYYARLVDGDGRETPALVVGCEPVLRHAPLRKGENARGLWTFDLPARKSTLELVYRPRLLDPGIDSAARVAVGSP